MTLSACKRLFRSDSLLLASAFPCKSLALSAGAVEFVVLSGRAVEAVGTLTQRVTLRARLSPVLNYHRLVWVRDPGNWRDLTLAIWPMVPLVVFPTWPKASRFSNFIAISFTSAGWPIACGGNR